MPARTHGSCRADIHPRAFRARAAIPAHAHPPAHTAAP
ncbi:hypothetical protein DA2_0642 [Desulfovibrio sp. A2]|nr:hypothetical protein DA2_0642 [Desulfovibrio sp. A2]